MDKKIKKVIERISKTDITREVEILGDVIRDVLFSSKKMAVYIDKVKGRCVILLPSPHKTTDVQSSLLMLTELLAVLDDIKNKHLIYLIEKNAVEEYLFYEGKRYFEEDQRPNVYRIAEDTTFEIQSENLMLKYKGHGFMKGVEMDSHFSSELVTFLSSRAMPTKALKEYVKRGYKTKEEQNLKRSLKYSLISMFVAVFVAAFSPFLSVYVSNCIGISTINREQLDSLLHRAKPVYIIPMTLENAEEKKDMNNLNTKIKKGNHGN